MNVYGVLHRLIDAAPLGSEQDFRDLHDAVTASELGHDSLEDYREQQARDARAQSADQQRAQAESGGQVVLTGDQAREWLAQQNERTGSRSLSDSEVASTRPSGVAQSETDASVGFASPASESRLSGGATAQSDATGASTASTSAAQNPSVASDVGAGTPGGSPSQDTASTSNTAASTESQAAGSSPSTGISSTPF